MRSTVSDLLQSSAVIVGTFATGAGLLGLLGVAANLPQFCPSFIEPARCRSGLAKSAGFVSYSLIGAGAAGLLVMGAKVADPEA